MAPSGLLILVQWTKTHQSFGKALILPVPGVTGHSADPVATYRQLLASSPTMSPDQSFLTYTTQHLCTTVIVSMLSRALSILMDALGLDPGLFSENLSTAFGVWGGAQQPTGRSWTSSTSSVRDCGPVMHSGTM